MNLLDRWQAVFISIGDVRNKKNWNLNELGWKQAVCFSIGDCCEAWKEKTSESTRLVASCLLFCWRPLWGREIRNPESE